MASGNGTQRAEFFTEGNEGNEGLRLGMFYGGTDGPFPLSPITFHIPSSLCAFAPLRRARNASAAADAGGSLREIFSALSVVTQTGKRMENRIRSYPKLPISARNR
jgi:hypothetical protein